MTLSESVTFNATAINGAWILADIPDRGFNGSRPYFIGVYHDLSAKDISERLPIPLAFAVTTILACLMSIGNIVIYVQRGVKRDFLMLISLLHFRNITFATGHLLLMAGALTTGSFEWPSSVCTGIYWYLWVSGIFGLGILAIISYERRLCIASHNIHFQNTSRLAMLTAIVLLLCCAIPTAIFYWPLQAFSVKTFLLENNGKVVRLCGHYEYKLGGDGFDTSFFLVLMYALATGITIPIISYNYWSIFSTIYRIRTASCGAQNTTKQQTVFRASPVTYRGMPSDAVTVWQRREIFLVKQSIVYVVLLVIFHVPGLISYIIPMFWNSALTITMATPSLRSGTHLLIVAEMVVGTLVHNVKSNQVDVVMKCFGSSRRTKKQTAVSPFGGSINSTGTTLDHKF